MNQNTDVSASSIGLRSKLGVWLKRLSIVAVLAIPVAVVGFRFHLYDFSIASKVLALSLFLSAIVFLCSLLVALIQRKSNPVSSKAARLASYLCLLPLLFLGSQIITAKSLPMIHNISTDITNPPEFDQIIELRGEKSNPHSYDIEALAAVQSKAYPKIKTLIVKSDTETAFNRALSVVSSLGWKLVSKDSKKGLIEATQTSALWQFKDDIVIRIVSDGNSTKIDLRSVSRVGRSDLGVNAKRIYSFLDAYQE